MDFVVFHLFIQNIPSVTPQVEPSKGRMYADTPNLGCREVVSDRPSAQGKETQSSLKKK